MKNLGRIFALVVMAAAPQLCNAWGRCTPIVIDLGNNGIDLGPAGVGVRFDVNEDQLHRVGRGRLRIGERDARGFG